MNTPDKTFNTNLEDTEILFERTGDTETVRSDNDDGDNGNDVPDVTYLPV